MRNYSFANIAPRAVSDHVSRGGGNRGERKDFHRVGDLPARTSGAGKAVLVLHPPSRMRLPRES